MIKSKALLLTLSFLPLLSACTSEKDLYGVDPHEYYATHPIENKVEIKSALLPISFDGSSTSILPKYNEALRDLKNINPSAVEKITLYVGNKMTYKTARVERVKVLLSKYKVPFELVTNKKMGRNKLVIDITYAVVITPDCPDWKKSSVTTYSNMNPANFGCSAVVNLGLMVDDPHDLVRGKASRIHNTELSSKAISDYRSGEVADASSELSATGQ